MSMIFCRGCGKQIHETAPTCPHCGSLQQLVTPVAQQARNPAIWMAIVSIVFGIISALALFDDSEWDKNKLLGLGIFSCIGLVLGVMSISKKMAGKGMAIAGVVLSSIAFLMFLGLNVK